MRNYNLCVSLNPEEKALVTALAAKHNMKPTAYVKHLILSKENKPMMFIPGSDMSSEIGSKHQCIKGFQQLKKSVLPIYLSARKFTYGRL